MIFRSRSGSGVCTVEDLAMRASYTMNAEKRIVLRFLFGRFLELRLGDRAKFSAPECFHVLDYDRKPDANSIGRVVGRLREKLARQAGWVGHFRIEVRNSRIPHRFYLAAVFLTVAVVFTAAAVVRFFT